MEQQRAYVRTFGCLQNENDSEKIRGILSNMGYAFCDNEKEADVIIYNTCAVRDNAEKRVYGNVGALRRLKEDKPELLIGICGCMMQQQHAVDYVKRRFPFVDFIFGTHTLHRLPEILHSAMSQRVVDIEEVADDIRISLPQKRDSAVTANVSIMYGCNNFCSYCIVPYVRGRERSRASKDILTEVQGLAAQGYSEVTLLGQNVNSYGKDCGEIDFADLLDLVSTVDGIERIRFISSHPKDISEKLLQTMAKNPKVCKQLHLPFQAGSTRVLKEMNRRYTRDDYLKIIERARSYMPGLSLSSDVIVGFPTETQADFEDTMSLVREVEFANLYTFIYSPRKGTPAATMPKVLTAQENKANFNRLLSLQNDICAKHNAALVGTVQHVLVEGHSKTTSSTLTGRTEQDKVVNFKGDESLIGKLIPLKITRAAAWSLTGELIEEEL